MLKVNDILRAVEKFAPLSLAIDDDNNGLLAGRSDASVERVLVAIDVTMAVIEEAIDIGAQLIVTHHPGNRGMKAVTDVAGYGERRMLTLLENKIALISMHTNLDAVQGGINDVLAELCGLRDVRVLDADTPNGRIGRVGMLESQLSAHEYAAKVSEILGCKALRFCDGGKPIHKVAVCGGGGGSVYGEVAAAGCDAYITGDVKYHLWLEAVESGMTLIDAGHFETEVIMCNILQPILAKTFPNIDARVSQCMHLPYEVL